MSRRANYEGSVYRRQDGRWCAALSVAGRRITVYAKTRQEAVDRLRQLQRLAESAGRLPDARRLTLAAYLNLWLDQASDRLRPKTLANYRQLVERIQAHAVGRLRLTQLTGLHLTRCYPQLKASGFVQRQVHALLHKALNDAQRWGLLASNPAARVDRPKPQPQPRRLWTPEQLATFLAGVEGQYADLFIFLLASACRLGEALGLRWGEVDWQAGTVRIERQVTEVGGKPVEGAPKSQAGVRTIALPGWGLAALRRQQERVRGWQLESGDAFAPGWRRCFPTRTGGVPEATNLRRALRRACEGLGLPAMRIHDLRHLSLSWLAAQGIPVKDLQRRAGHSSPTLTLQVYTHVLADSDQRAAHALEELKRGGATSERVAHSAGH